jgi:ankyrin repeat protein
VVNALLESRADASMTRNDDGCTALHLASARGSAEIVEALLGPCDGGDTHCTLAGMVQAADSDPCCPSDSSTSADKEGSNRVLPHLVDVQTSSGITALVLASEAGALSVVKCLLQRGASVNVVAHDSSTTALLRAIVGGHTVCAEVLLDAGALLTDLTDAGLPNWVRCCCCWCVCVCMCWSSWSSVSLTPMCCRSSRTGLAAALLVVVLRFVCWVSAAREQAECSTLSIAILC